MRGDVRRRRVGILGLLCALLLASLGQTAGADELVVTVADPFIELRTGPGRGYPVFHVVEQGQPVTLIQRRTQWVEVRAPRGHQGWVSRAQLGRTLDGTGEYLALQERSLSDYFRPHGEFGVGVGELAGTTSLTVQGGWAFTDRMRLELAWTQANSDFASRRLLDVSLSALLAPRRRVSPYVLVGTGRVKVTPRTVLVNADVRNERSVQAGAGVRAYLTRSFIWRAEYRHYVFLTDKDDNEELEQWRTGFSVLF
ncbi:SH3 domain-containing protein [Alcanivorax sp. JB21]|uniref:SH3 domain-containing protein n=1 Tax=Alcanivorax limicola TaxID=2874102 RepID=UPI001CBF52A3|nr:SH3 domain-containing protein [Alcanivorax limicola]MBZ2190148.1 SH3 domain-containing protein [Alcanivorax limicola]